MIYLESRMLQGKTMEHQTSSSSHAQNSLRSCKGWSLDFGLKKGKIALRVPWNPMKYLKFPPLPKSITGVFFWGGGRSKQILQPTAFDINYWLIGSINNLAFHQKAWLRFAESQHNPCRATTPHHPPFPSESPPFRTSRCDVWELLISAALRSTCTLMNSQRTPLPTQTKGNIPSINLWLSPPFPLKQLLIFVYYMIF